ncbi:hypothetical protein ACQPZX_29740 [Actinoplanes sp. CA-142083]|uniref:hypothetical protein n=1 Tax=Actinoplanes sp. CA-142083 TaxID=3239903 RepID=UPI003D900356
MFVSSAIVAALLIAAALPVLRGWLPHLALPDHTARTAVQPALTAAGGPFTGTVADKYPVGQAGIVLPKAKAIDTFTVAEVDAALKQVRRALIAGRLEERMLVRHDTSAFVALISPAQRPEAKRWAKESRMSGVATWIDPAVKLDPKYPPRVSGKVTFGVVTYEGRQHLQVTTNFVWVYAFKQGEPPYAAVHDSVVWEFYKASEVSAKYRGMQVIDWHSYFFAMDCVASDKNLLSPNRHPRRGFDRDHEDSDDYLSPDHPLEVRDGCI